MSFVSTYNVGLKIAIEREQSQACLNYAEREQFGAKLNNNQNNQQNSNNNWALCCSLCKSTSRMNI